MSSRSLAKTTDEVYMDFYRQYRSEHDGPVRMEDIARWIDGNGLLPKPEVSAVRVHTRALKQAARRNRGRDPQNRNVRTVIPAKIEYKDARGNQIFEVVWDYLHNASQTHLLTHFQQRDEVIEKQRRSASRDLDSALDNNPNVNGCRDQFKFAFMIDEPIVQVEQTVEESPSPEKPGKPKPR